MNRLVSVLLLVAALASLGAAGRMHPRLLELRRAAHLNQGDPLENAPPMVAFSTVALGAFRGLAVDLLWMRATELQDKGRYFELVQLADWITKLQPRFASIWAYQSWNLSYNVSVMFSEPADRWRWVRHGLSLLRDEGLRYNPGSPLLYRELAWTFQHKLGGDSDTAHRYYKRMWAAEMEDLFGGPRPDLETLAALPASAEDLLREPAVAALARDLRAAGADPLDARWLAPDGGPAGGRARMAADPAGARLRAWLRARRMREQYRLDPAAMLETERRYGPLEWRLPQAHAVHWCLQGMRWARADFDRIALQRQIFQAMADAFLRGRLTRDPARDVFQISPNLALLPRVRAAYEEALREHPGNETMTTGHMNFLTDAIVISYAYNRVDQARELYADLVRRYAPPGGASDFETFVSRAWTEYSETMNPGEAMAAVEGALYQGLFWKALGDDEQASGYERLARLCWDRYMAHRTNDTDMLERTGLASIEQIRDRAAERVRADLAAPPAPR